MSFYRIKYEPERKVFGDGVREVVNGPPPTPRSGLGKSFILNLNLNFQVRSQRTDSFVHTILVDPVSYSSMVGVTADGFEPATVTIAKVGTVFLVIVREERVSKLRDEATRGN